MRESGEWKLKTYEMGRESFVKLPEWGNVTLTRLTGEYGVDLLQKRKFNLNTAMPLIIISHHHCCKSGMWYVLFIPPRHNSNSLEIKTII
jgi:hypothetical protein